MEPAAKYCVVPDDFVDVDIIQVNNCRNFFLCLDWNVAMDLSECVDTYYNAIEPKPVSEIQINHFYSVHNQEDQKYYRGQVLAQAFQENLFWVRLIDCGRIQAIPAMGIFTLVPHYATNNFPISVLNCFISGNFQLLVFKCLICFFRFVEQRLHVDGSFIFCQVLPESTITKH